jgi:DNA-binding NarL/FixJ family response regulator
MSALSEDALPRLMIADDDPVVQTMLDMSLSYEFDVVGLAADGKEAIGGLRAVRGIHEVAPDTAIVVLSVDESEGVIRELMQAGAVAYLRKGVAPKVVAEALRNSIEAHAVERREWP